MTPREMADNADPSDGMSFDDTDENRSPIGPESNYRLGTVAVLAGVIGVLAGIIAFLIYRLIGFLVNLFFYRRISFEFITPPNAGLPVWVVLIPAFGGLVIGLMAKYGSPRIRGHGIPEAMEAVWDNESQVKPRVMLLKPISAALAIGTGAPFGVEGPIIQTGGSMGSVIGQYIPTTVAERKVLLACGAAAGMAATFNTPIAGVLIAIELLLFEFRMRSFVPLSVASVIATAVRRQLIGTEPLIRMCAPSVEQCELGYQLLPNLPFLLVLGVLLGGATVVFKRGYFRIEDQFHRVPVGNVLLPAIGGLILGIMGLFVPRILGVGYEVASEILQNELPIGLLLLVVVGKAVGVSVTLGTRTSGGFLAPMFVIGAGIGGAFALAVNALVPGITLPVGLFALAGLGTLFGVAARATFALVLFAVEVTQQFEAILPVFLVAVVADGVASLYLRNSLMTEELTRRGIDIYQEYEVDPLKRYTVNDIMDKRPVTIRPDVNVAELVAELTSDSPSVARFDAELEGDEPEVLHRPGDTGTTPEDTTELTLHEGLPIVDAETGLIGIITYGDMLRAVTQNGEDTTVAEAGTTDIVSGYPDEQVFEAAVRMAANDLEQLPIIDRDGGGLVGLIDSQNLMTSSILQLEEEQVREEGKVDFERGLL
jgi:CIC family chloride channel protein